MFNYKHRWSSSSVLASYWCYPLYIKHWHSHSGTFAEPLLLAKYTTEIIPISHLLNVIFLPLLGKYKNKEHNPFCLWYHLCEFNKERFAYKWNNNIRCPLDGLFIEVPEHVSISNQLYLLWMYLCLIYYIWWKPDKAFDTRADTL